MCFCISIVDDISVTTFRLTRAEEAKILAAEPSQLQLIEEEFVSDFPTSPVAALCGAFRRLDSTYFENSLIGRTLIRIHMPNSPLSTECPHFVSELFCDSTHRDEVEGEPHMVFVINDRMPQKPNLTVWIAADDLGAGSPVSTLKLLFRGLAQARHGMRRCDVPLREWKGL